MSIKKILAASLFSAVALFAGTYNVDRAHSSVTFKVKHMMISNVKGSFDKFDGKFEYDEKANALKQLDGVIKVDSINTGNGKRDNHLKADDMFNAKKYPSITFKLTKIDGDEAYGDFTMMGVTKNIKLDYEAGGTANGRFGKIAAFSLSGKIKRSEFGLTWNELIESGGVAVSDTVKLEIDIEGVEAK